MSCFQIYVNKQLIGDPEQLQENPNKMHANDKVIDDAWTHHLNEEIVISEWDNLGWRIKKVEMRPKY